MPCPTRFGVALIAALAMTGSAEAASVGVCGGSGGSQSKTLSCPAGHYIVGLFQRRGAFVDRIGIRCASVNSAGKRGKLGAFQYAGGTGGSRSKSATCSGNRAVVDVDVFSGIYVDQLHTSICQPRQPQGAFQEEDPVRFISPAVDSNDLAGSPCHLVCPQGEALHRFIVRYGGWVDSIEGFCRP